MRITPRPYNPTPDFLRIRDLLAGTYTDFDALADWGIERWNEAPHLGDPQSLAR